MSACRRADGVVYMLMRIGRSRGELGCVPNEGHIDGSYLASPSSCASFPSSCPSCQAHQYHRQCELSCHCPGGKIMEVYSLWTEPARTAHGQERIGSRYPMWPFGLINPSGTLGMLDSDQLCLQVRRVRCPRKARATVATWHRSTGVNSFCTATARALQAVKVITSQSPEDFLCEEACHARFTAHRKQQK
jgi:hypothetical protein